jgi:tetratricopeptide (TPR) repeat protein
MITNSRLPAALFACLCTGCLRWPTPVPESRVSRPIVWELPSQPDAFTEQKLARQTAASLSRQWQEAHAERGLPCPGVEPDLSAFFDDVGAWQAQLPNAPAPEALWTRAEILRAAPCDDPALLHCLGLLLQDAGRYPEAFDLFLQAAARYDQLDFPGVLKARNAVAIYNTIHQIGDDHDKDQCFRWKDRALEFLAQGLARDPLRTEDLRPLYAHISQNWTCIYWTRDGDYRHIVSRRLAELGGGEPWLTRMMLGRDAYRKAWVSRGPGMANTVSPEGWRGFGDHYADADGHLRAALELHPEFPEPYNFLIDIAGAGPNAGPETVYDLFRRTVAAQIDYWPAYQSFVFHTLPRWGGTPEQLFAILKMVSENQRFDTRVPQYALAIYQTVASDRIVFPTPYIRRGITVSPWRDPAGWAIFHRVYEGYLRHPGPIPYERDFLLGAYLDYAHQFDLPREFLRILRRYTPAIPLESNAFLTAHGYPLRLAEAKARLQIDSDTFVHFRTALDRRDFDTAERHLAALERRGADSGYLATLRRSMQIRAHLEPEPEWREQPACPTPYPWEEVRGKCRAALDGAFLGQTQDEINFMLLDRSLGDNREIAADVSIVENTTLAEDNVALLVAKDKSTFVSLAWLPRRGEVVLALSRGERHVRPVAAPAGTATGPQRLRLRVEHNRFSAWFNGECIFVGVAFAGVDWTDSARLGLGGLYPAAGASVLFENVRMRPLPPANPEPT